MSNKGNRTTIKPAIAALAALMALALASCASVQEDVLYAAPEGGAASRLEPLQLSLVALRARADQPSFAQARAEIKALLDKPSTDPLYRARLLAIAADAALMAGDRNDAARKLAESRSAYAGDEFAAVVASRLARTNDQRVAELEAALLVADGFYLIRAELGAALHDLGRHREALAAFDAALPFLADEYRLLYGPQRERSWALRETGADLAASSAAHLNADTISAVGMAVLAQNETSALDWLTGGAPWAPGVLFDRLKASGWYARSDMVQKTPMTRKDAALFLWNLMARGESRILTRYSLRYAARGTSPVPDVLYTDPWFDAVLGVVEEGVMTLPDGRAFRPDESVNGLSFYSWLKAAAAWR